MFHLAAGSERLVSGKSVATNSTNPVGAGPCRLAGRNRGASLALTRNEDYQDQVVGAVSKSLHAGTRPGTRQRRVRNSRKGVSIRVQFTTGYSGLEVPI